jgi:hypothetical protein
MYKQTGTKNFWEKQNEPKIYMISQQNNSEITIAAYLHRVGKHCYHLSDICEILLIFSPLKFINIIKKRNYKILYKFLKI